MRKTKFLLNSTYLIISFIMLPLVGLAQKKALITNQNDNSVTILNLADNSTSTVTVGDNPVAVAITPDGTKAVVANENGDNVTIINLADNSTSTVTVGEEPVGVAITPDGTKALVTNKEDDNVTIINLADNTTITTVTVGDNPLGVAITSDGTKAVIANFNDNNVTIINLADNSTSTVAVGVDPSGVAITPGGNDVKAVVTNAGGSNVTIINLADNSTSTVAVGSVPLRVAITPDGTKAVVANNSGDQVTIINLTDNSTAPVTVGNSPGGVAITPDGTKALVTNRDDDEVSIIKLADNSTSTVTVGDYPYGVAIYCATPITIAATTQASEDAIDGLFTLTTSSLFSAATTVNVTITGTATNGTDYANIPTTVNFPANSNTATIAVDVNADTDIEGLETVIATLTAGIGYTVGIAPNNTATVNITDNDNHTLLVKSGNKLMFDDPCQCDDPRNCNVGGIDYFHDTLTITGGVTGLTITAAAGATNFFTSVDCFGGATNIITTGTTIPENPAGSGIYKIEFWRPSGEIPTLFVIESGVTTTVPTSTFQPVCTTAACTPQTPIPTMSQWGLLIFGLMVINISVFFVQRRALI